VWQSFAKIGQGHAALWNRVLNKCSAGAEMGDCLATTDMGRNLGGCAHWGGVGSASNTMLPEPRPTTVTIKWHLDPSSRLATTNMGRKLGGSAPCWGGGAGSPLAQCCLGRGLHPHQVTSWSIQRFGHNRHGLKIGGCPFFGEGSWSHLTQCRLG